MTRDAARDSPRDAHTLPADIFDLQQFVSAFDATDPRTYCREALHLARERQHQAFREGASATDLVHQRALLIDALLGALWDRQDWGGAELALVAVGGYGRGELHPYSDIDLLVILGDGCDAAATPLGDYLTFLGDIRLQPGYAVRSVDECVALAKDDITVVTNLMETHLIRGSTELLMRVKALTGPEHMWPSEPFFRAKLAEQDERHQRFADTEYNLEPNVKSSPGGLRDLQVIGWIAERHFGVNALEEIRDTAFLNDEEREILINGREFMWQVRYALHVLTGRGEDQLRFDRQRELAQMWGLEDGEQKLAVEKFMQVYYRWASALGQLNDLLIQNFEQAILRSRGEEDEVRILDEWFQVRNGYIEARTAEVFNQHPPALLELFRFCAYDPGIVGIAAPTIRLVRDSRHLVDKQFRAEPRNRKTFIEILRGPEKMTRQLRRMTRYGILGDYLPEFGRIMGQMQHDMFHAYTVDAHTLEVIKNARRFQFDVYEEHFPVSCQVARGLRKVELLYIAALYHDIGKGRGGNHSELGAVDAQQFCEKHYLDERDTELVVWLVRNHLLMSSVSQRKDISDPEIIAQFAQDMGDLEHLDYLYTLTVADINGTNPNLWNAWRSSLLRQLYTAASSALQRGPGHRIDKDDLVAQEKAEAAKLLTGRGFAAQELEDIWRQRGDDYFLRERAEDIVWHTQAVAGHHDTDTPLVLTRHSTDSSVANTTQIFIHTRERAQLFSRICNALEQLQLSVFDARLYSANDEMILDTFFVLGSDGQPIGDDAERLNEIRKHLTDALRLDAPMLAITEKMTSPQIKALAFPTTTTMYQDEAKNVTVLEVSTPDRPGLLARLGRIFVSFNIELQAAKIQTLGERVEDIFFITDQLEQPITDPEVCELIQQTIRDELDTPVAA